MTSDESFMKQAVKQAKKAYDKLETPIGCVIVHEDKIIARGYNKRNMKKNTLAHAEILAINKASKVLGDWRLEDCTMYVTLEPCPMCAGAIVQARIPRVVIGSMNPKAGCCFPYREGDRFKFPCSRGDSGALYLQSAIAGVLSHRGSFDGELPKVSGVDTWVLRNRNL